jgi:hypothetical protein
MKYPRRSILKGAAAGAILGLVPVARAADLPQGLTLFSDTGPNVLLLKTTAGLVLVDSGADARSQPRGRNTPFPGCPTWQ